MLTLNFHVVWMQIHFARANSATLYTNKLGVLIFIAGYGTEIYVSDPKFIR